MSLQSRKSCQAGLTLIEVLTAASILGILSVIGASNFRAQIPAFRTRGAALMIAGDINQARLAAVKRHLRYAFALALDNSEAIADTLAPYMSLRRTPETINKVYAMYDEVTAEDIQRVARKYFQENSRTIATLSGGVSK